MANNPLLLVSWKDHSADGSWADVDKFHGPSICNSVGWLFKEDDEGMTIVANIGDADETGNLQYILKSCIVSRVELKVPAKRKPKKNPEKGPQP